MHDWLYVLQKKKKKQTYNFISQIFSQQTTTFHGNQSFSQNNTSSSTDRLDLKFN